MRSLGTPDYRALFMLQLYKSALYVTCGDGYGYAAEFMKLYKVQYTCKYSYICRISVFTQRSQRLVADLSCIFANSKENECNITQGLYVDTRQKDSTEILDT